jgi:hypothetical protein
MGFSLLILLVNGDELLLGVHTADLELSLPDNHLMEFSQSLLALVSLKLTPKF